MFLSCFFPVPVFSRSLPGTSLITTFPQVQTMAVKVDLYSALEGKADSGARSSGGKGGHGGGGGGGGGGFSRQTDKLGVVEESPKPNSTMTIAKGKKLKELQKKS